MYSYKTIVLTTAYYRVQYCDRATTVYYQDYKGIRLCYSVLQKLLWPIYTLLITMGQ